MEEHRASQRAEGEAEEDALTSDGSTVIVPENEAVEVAEDLFTDDASEAPKAKRKRS